MATTSNSSSSDHGRQQEASENGSGPKRKRVLVAKSAGVPKVSESCLHLLVTEIVKYSALSVEDAMDPKQAMHMKIERMGFLTGMKVVERMAASRGRFSGDLERIKFICKDFWTELFKKQIDNLRTNHRGVFVLYDSRFRWLTPLSGPQVKTESVKYLLYPAGLIRGGLQALGITCTVTSETQQVPSCTFTIKISSSSSSA